MIAILLSVYNGEQFLCEQLDSIVSQSFQDFIVWVRDDGSHDSSKEIIEKYKTLYPSKFELVDWNSHQNLGFGSSFLRLLEVAAGELYFFCDQDDVWHYTKLADYLECYEACKTKNLPLLLISDFSIFKKEINFKSFYKSLGIRTSQDVSIQFSFLFSGCTYCLNTNLRNTVVSSKVMHKFGHDVKTFFIALLEGEIRFLPKSTMKYRIHSNNLCGYKRTQGIIVSIKDFMKYFYSSNEYRKIILRPYFELYENLKLSYDKDILQTNELYCEEDINSLNFIQRKLWYQKHFLPFFPSYIEGILKVLTF
ncbi:MAG: glycosyltransferase [Chitinophagales bacterium]|nr:glycosyltransferase [Chitinophagales bacterium]